MVIVTGIVIAVVIVIVIVIAIVIVIVMVMILVIVMVVVAVAAIATAIAMSPLFRQGAQLSPGKNVGAGPSINCQAIDLPPQPFLFVGGTAPNNYAWRFRFNLFITFSFSKST